MVSDDNFSLAFEQQAEIERRLKSLNDYNKEIAENQIKRTILVNKKIKSKLWPVLGPLLNIIAQAMSWGAKGLAWLANNLWVLAIAFVWFIYDQYKQRRK